MDFKDRFQHEVDFTKRKMHPCRVAVIALLALAAILCVTAGIGWILSQVVTALELRGY